MTPKSLIINMSADFPKLKSLLSDIWSDWPQFSVRPYGILSDQRKFVKIKKILRKHEQ